MMARARVEAASGVAASEEVSWGKAARIFPAGKETPITPVEDGSTWCWRQPSSLAARLQIASQAERPCLPVAQFALPELTMMARTLAADFLRFRAPMMSGAAFTRLLVNNTAAAAPAGASAMQRSSRSWYLIPAATAAKRNPRGMLSCSGSIAIASRHLSVTNSWRANAGRATVRGLDAASSP